MLFNKWQFLRLAESKCSINISNVIGFSRAKKMQRFAILVVVMMPRLMHLKSVSSKKYFIDKKDMRFAYRSNPPQYDAKRTYHDYTVYHKFKVNSVDCKFLFCIYTIRVEDTFIRFFIKPTIVFKNID